MNLCPFMRTAARIDKLGVTGSLPVPLTNESAAQTGLLFSSSEDELAANGVDASKMSAISPDFWSGVVTALLDAGGDVALRGR
jgi:hypothetical protein